jgi:hypothetical protein
MREKVMRNSRKLQNEEICNPYSLPGSRAITGNCERGGIMWHEWERGKMNKKIGRKS